MLSKALDTIIEALGGDNREDIFAIAYAQELGFKAVPDETGGVDTSGTPNRPYMFILDDYKVWETMNNEEVSWCAARCVDGVFYEHKYSVSIYKALHDASHRHSKDKIEITALNAKRYEMLIKVTPEQFSAMYARHLSEKIPLNTLVDMLEE